ncbi:MAG TPA: hypothetical protein VMY37_18250 [Thermoguttaceae bacterium]|nr:hypothetical protein [Thermoguttaceae bacterium]
MLSPDLKVAVRSAAELFHRSRRLREHLERIGPGESGEHARLVETMRRALEDIEDTMMGNFALLWEVLPQEQRATMTSPGPEEDTPLAEVFNGLLLTLNHFSLRFVTIHESLVYLPWQSVEPELVFSLEGCFPEFCKRYQPSIVMGSLFNAFEFDFIKILKQKLADIAEVFSGDERNFVLMFAICDGLSPLACAILAHEVGHALDAEHDISRTVANESVFASNSLPSGTLLNWCREICADLIAAQMVGPSPILSLLSMEYCLYPSQNICQHGASHPSTRARLRILADDPAQSTATAPLPSELEVYENAWRLNLASVFPNDTERQEEEQKHDLQMENLHFRMARHLREKLSSLGEALPRACFENDSLERCKKRLRLGSPVSAQGDDPKLLVEKVKEHIRNWPEPSEARCDAFKNLCDEFRETPVKVPNILLSGYRRRWGIIEELYDKPEPLANAASVKWLCDSMAGLDRLIGSSIVTTCVHKEVLRRLETNRRRKKGA